MDSFSSPESKKVKSDKCNNDEALQRRQRETEEELKNAKRTFMNTENVVKLSRTGNRSCTNPGNNVMKKPVSKPSISAQPPPCKQNFGTRKRETIPNSAKVANENECLYSGPRSKGRRDVKDVLGFIQRTTPDFSTVGNGGTKNDKRELPKKPKLTREQLLELLKQETHDVESARILTSDVKESYKKPCPKQQKARDEAKAVMEPKKEEPSVTCIPLTIIKEPSPLVDPDSEDISPEMAANMMYMLERGIKMVSSPQGTVKHLFFDQFPDDDKNAESKEERSDVKEKQGTPEVTGEGVDDSVFTRNMTQSESGEEDKASSKYYDATNRANDKIREFLLQEKIATCTNRVQLRGHLPSWFPGYFVAFPDQVGDNDIQLAKSPSEIFQRAWMVAKPSQIRSADVYLVD